MTEKEKGGSGEYEPKIIGFLCEACAFVGLDKAGIHRIEYPPNMRIIRLMCSGRLEPDHILEAFRSGVDGVFIGGCHLGECHYEKGNYKTKKRYLLMKRMLPQFGIDPRRLRLEWIDASEGDRFAAVAREFTEEVSRLGPIGKPYGVG